MPAALDLALIKTFLTVIDAKGFKPAAEQMYKTPAAVSQQIKRLEEILGKRVLERSNQGISLTSAGEILKEKGQRLLTLNYELLGDLRENELSGQLNFGAPTDYAPTLLQKLLPIFQTDFPRVLPNITLEPSRVLRRRVNAGTLDMAIVAREPGTNEGSELWTEEIAWFNSTLNGDEPARVGVLTTDCVLREHALHHLKESSCAFDLVLEAATVASLRDAVEAGFCRALLPTSMAERFAPAPLKNSLQTLQLSFCLIAGPRFDADTTKKVSAKFRRAL
ncbi:LysR family transcriptional regulator [Pelagibius sp. Alg239-R121]|uniref:LysR family transcriptional regulator n=1 Tax=Pelagibius sp. Alg239-R121 TaxID=2993448 RepID=UPI0024A73ABF|nr:LysR family transcriptional regulator [Pelagibius sp. Alg239-R121]